MKNILVALILITVVFTGCSQAPASQPIMKPESVVAAFLQAASAGDVGNCVSLLADDVVFRQEPSGTSTVGKEQIEAGIQLQVAWHQQYSIVSPFKIEGDKVMLTIRQTGDDCRIIGLEYITCDLEVQVSDGKIKSWTVSMNQEDLKKVTELTAGGIGVKFEATAQGIKVTGMAKNSPAYEAGLRPGDLIIAVDGISFSQMREGEIQLRIKGPVGSKVKLTITNQGAPARDIEVTRINMAQLSF